MRLWFRSLQSRRWLCGKKHSNIGTRFYTSKSKLNGLIHQRLSLPIQVHTLRDLRKCLRIFKVDKRDASLTTARFNSSLGANLQQHADHDVVDKAQLFGIASSNAGFDEGGSKEDASVDPFILRQVRCTDAHGVAIDGIVIELGHMLNPSTLSRQIKFFLEARPEPALLFDCNSVHIMTEVKQWAAHLGLVHKMLYLPDAEHRALVGLLKSPRALNQASRSWDTSIVKAGSYLVQLCQDIVQTSDLAKSLGRAQLGALWLNHWHVLMLACKGHVDALPDLLLSPKLDGGNKHGHQERPSYDFTLRNGRFDIKITKSGVVHSKFDGVRDFLEVLMQYCKAITQALQLASLKQPLTFGTDVMAPAEFVQRVTKAMDFGDVKFNSYAENTPLAWPSESMWSSRLELAQLQDELPSATWPHRKHAQALAAMKAAAWLKPRVEQAWKDAHITPTRYVEIARLWTDQNTLTELLHTRNPKGGKNRVFEVPLHDRVLSAMTETLGNLMSRSFPVRFQWESISTARRLSCLKPRSWSRVPSLDEMLQKDRTARTSSPTFHKILLQQNSLPLRQGDYSSRISCAVEDHDVVVITAATGSGKTTQISQIIYDHAISTGKGSLCNIVCTQPRRIATTSVAQRVATERLQSLGKEVGYRVRFRNRAPHVPNAITFMTSGMLLRLIESDPEYYLSQFSHIILDEVHVRDIDSDLLLTILTNNLCLPFSKTNPRPKIILMSATIESGRLVDYVQKANASAKVAHIHIPGKTYPVESKFLDDITADLDSRDSPMIQPLAQDADTKDYLALQQRCVCHECKQFDASNKDDVQLHDVPWFPFERMPIMLITACIADVMRTTSNGDILVFLPGLGEIEAVEKQLLDNSVSGMNIGLDGDFRIFKLHSSLYDTNYNVFKPIPRGVRRLVLATNIAETSLTIPDVVYVIDSGLSRQSVHNQVEESAQFGLTWISKAEVRQRRGRCGRTLPGHYIALFSKDQYDAMPDEPYPEILRTNLTSIILRVQDSDAYQLPQIKRDEGEVASGPTSKAAALLRTTLSPPRTSDVEAATQQLRRMRALHDDNSVTALGRAISALPTEPSRSKPVLLGILFKCLDPLLIAAASSQDLPIVHEPLKKGAAYGVRKQYSAGQDSDLLADIKIFMEYSRASELGDWHRLSTLEQDHFVRPATAREMTRIAQQIASEVRPLYAPEEGSGFFSQEAGTRRSRSPATPAALNEHSLNDALIKALSFSTAGTRIARWRKKNWFTAQHSRVLPRPQSVNYTRGAKETRAAIARREDGDLCSYRSLRKSPDAVYPWIEETSIVSPLTGMLFGASLSLDGDILVVNDFVKYKIDSPNLGSLKAAKIIFEFRKAFDRFLGLAFCNIDTSRQSQQLDGAEGNINEYFSNLDHPFREIFVDSIVKILEIDTVDRNERAQQRCEAAEEEGIAREQERVASISEPKHSDGCTISLLEMDEEIDRQGEFDDLDDSEAGED